MAAAASANVKDVDAQIANLKAGNKLEEDQVRAFLRAVCPLHFLAFVFFSSSRFPTRSLTCWLPMGRRTSAVS